VLSAVFLGKLRKISGLYRLMVNVWNQVDFLVVSRQSPVMTGRGKFLPYITLGPCWATNSPALPCLPSGIL
jgi:hypothetical protein